MVEHIIIIIEEKRSHWNPVFVYMHIYIARSKKKKTVKSKPRRVDIFVFVTFQKSIIQRRNTREDNTGYDVTRTRDNIRCIIRIIIVAHPFPFIIFSSIRG